MRFLAIGCVLLAGCGRTPVIQQKDQADLRAKEAAPSSPKPGDIAATLSAPDLWGAFGSNAVQADAQYKGQWIKLTGAAREVQADDAGKYFIGFAVHADVGVSPKRYNSMTPQERKWFNEGMPSNAVISSVSMRLGRSYQPVS